MHWADASTLEVIQLLSEQGAAAHLLLLCTARPEFHPLWPMMARHTQITLNRLSTSNVREIIAQVAARDALTRKTIDTVIERTGGVPLFVEELTRAVLESGSARLAERDIPVTLHDSLTARLDRLGPAKEIIQIGSVLGTEFSYELLQAVHPIAEQALQNALRRATEAELVYARGIAPDATYRFKHSLIRDAAYEALLKSRRKELHRHIARAMDEKFLALKEAHPEVLARHWTEAGETEAAIAEWERAGKAAEARNAFKEAEQSYDQAAALLNLLPESAERDARELKLRQSNYPMLQMTKGYAAIETIKAAERAAALAEKSGTLKELVSLINSKATIAVDSGDFVAAQTLADQALELPRSRDSGCDVARGEILLRRRLGPGGATDLSPIFPMGTAHRHSAVDRTYDSVGLVGVAVVVVAGRAPVDIVIGVCDGGRGAASDILDRDVRILGRLFSGPDLHPPCAS